MVNPLFLPELREMLAEDNAAELTEFCNTLNAGRTAEFMEGLEDTDLWAVLQYADADRRAEIFGYFDEQRQVGLLQSQEPRQVAELVDRIPSDDRVDLFQQLTGTRAQTILPLLPVADRRDIQRLCSYDEGTAGSLMTSEVAMLSETLTVSGALEALGNQASELETIYYLYVVDEDNLLRGIVSTRQLVSSLRTPSRTLGDLMETDVVVAEVDEDQESVAEKVEHFNLLAIPVVDSGRQLLGIITHDDVIDVVREELTEDAHRIAAVEPLEEDYLRIGLLNLSWKRGIWLIILFFAALLTAFALEHYHEELNKFIWLVSFIPLIISAGGNSGSQSATLVITAMTSGQVELDQWRKVLGREVIVATVLGIFLALIGYAVAIFLAPTPVAALVIPMTLVAVIFVGCFFGASLPLIFQRLGLDPAMMSNPFVAGIVDILGIIIYINIARLLL
ncbi:magnesium transporter [Roseiconus lacunae]|uniref:Magnesium transporter MgtE n=1 Tax=Roseiconus lacunae TaxID=2605694 RepID=A0ABT7PRZ5_9BACT|nr:magnesium transporter [Roseiconus lacunae]MCD0462224.1 magnesium transporter [Roseiconus lacunae]MDM4019251.1 magnesium transporter [Roseiconus lacunae]WRQ50652.1 magnesium transporter [Stieleria sp. HD01]